MDNRTPIAVVVGVATVIGWSVGCVDHGDVDDLTGRALILAGEAPPAGDYPLPPHCIYDVALGDSPAELYCPDPATTVIRWTTADDPAAAEILLSTETNAGYDDEFDIDCWGEYYVEELRILDRSTGDERILFHHLSDCLVQIPTAAIEEAFALGDGRFAVRAAGVDDGATWSSELFVVDAAGDRGEDLLPGSVDKELVGVLDTGELVVLEKQQYDGIAETLVAVNPSSGDRRDLVGVDAAQIWRPAVSPDASAVLFQHRSEGGDCTLAVHAGGAVRWMDPSSLSSVDSLTIVGWGLGGRALLAAGDDMWVWDGADGTAPVVWVGPDRDGWTAREVLPPLPGTELLPVVESQDGGSKRVSWIDADGGRVSSCEPVPVVQALQWASGDAPVVVYGDGGSDSPTHNHVFACGADGTTVDLLDGQGLLGQPLADPYLY